jgi:hypothetical protein
MRYRIVQGPDGLYYPQGKVLFWWHFYRYLIGGSKWRFLQLQDAENFIEEKKKEEKLKDKKEYTTVKEL